MTRERFDRCLSLFRQASGAGFTLEGRFPREERAWCSLACQCSAEDMPRYAHIYAMLCADCGADFKAHQIAGKWEVMAWAERALDADEVVGAVEVFCP